MHKVSPRYTVLCVDDNQNNLFTLQTLLETLPNVQVLKALSADEALGILLKNHVDLILSDVQMPEVNGFEFAKILKSNKKTRDIPIVFVTAIFKDEEFIEQGFEIGAVDYITKPIDDNQLLNKIRLYLKLFEEKEKVALNERRLYDITQSIGDGVYTFDTDGKLTFINQEALKLLGFNAKELLGKRVHDYIHYKDRNGKQISADECEIRKSMHKGEKTVIKNGVLVKKDGSLLEVAITSTPLFIDGEVVGTVVTFHDRTNEIKIQRLEEQKNQNQKQFIHSMITMIESRDSYTAGHTRRVAHYSELIAKEMGYDEESIELLKQAAWLHDIGKISTPDSVLLKPGKLSSFEYELIQDHVNAGYKLLKEIDAYKDIAEIMHQHHERYDGSGYPKGLKGDEIHPLASIMMVADSFDAMTTNRIYKKKKSIEEALEELQRLSGTFYNPQVVDAAQKALHGVTIDDAISQVPQSAMEEQRFAYFYKDRLTGLYIKDYLDVYIRDFIGSREYRKYTVRLHNFSEYNREYGWSEGDRFLSEFALFLQNLYPTLAIFRIEGDDFLIVSEEELKNVYDSVSSYKRLKDSQVSLSIEEE